MERKHFFKSGLAAPGLMTLAPLVNSCKKSTETPSSTTGDGATTATGSTSPTGSCTVSPVEAEGPFPTKTPSPLVNGNIVSDRTGVPFTIRITNYYAKGKQGTSNASDHVFSDSLVSELASVSGSVSAGYVLTHVVTVSA